jgi:hypothetical protein
MKVKHQMVEENNSREFYKRWIEYHFENPGFYELFERFAREAMKTHDKIGARLLCERIRWYAQVEKGSDQYRVCNSFAAYYARLLMLDKPEFKSLFNTKALKSGVTDEDIIRDVIEPSRLVTGASGPQAA